MHPDGAELAQDLLAEIRRRRGAPQLAFAEPPRRLEGGRETTIARFRFVGLPAGDPLGGPLVLRLIPRHYDPRRAVWEAAVQNAASVAGFPAPEALLADSEPRIAGQAYFVMRCLPGRPMAGSLVSDLEKQSALGVGGRLRRGVAALASVVRRLPVLARTLAELQLRLHAIDPAPLLGQLDRESLRELAEVRAWLDEMSGVVEELRIASLRPVVEWLADRLPGEPTEERVIGHGDFGPHNILVEHGEISGVIDWSYARVAEPEFDVGNTLALLRLAPGFLPGAARLPAAAAAALLARRYLRVYTASRPLDRSRLRYHEAFRTGREMCMLARWRHLSVDRRPPTNAWNPACDYLDAHFEKLSGIAVRIPAE